MRNKIIVLLFILVVSLMVGGAWSFLKSSYVSHMISIRINKKIEQYGLRINFTEIVPSLPLGTRVKNVVLEIKNKDIEAKLYLKDLHFTFDLWSLFTSRIKLKEVRLKQARLVLSTNSQKTDSSWKELDSKQLYSELEKIKEHTPFAWGKLFFSDVLIEAKQQQWLIEHASIENRGVAWHATFKLDKLFKGNSYLPELLHGELLLSSKNLLIKRIDLFQGLGHLLIRGKLFSGQRGELVIDGDGQLAYYNKLLKLDSYLEQGRFNFSINLKINRTLSFTGNIQLKDLKTSLIDFKKITGSISFKDNIFKINKLQGKDKYDGLYQLNDSISVFDLSDEKLLIKTVGIKLKSASISNILKSIQVKKVGLEGRVSGDVLLSLDEKNLSVRSKKELLLQQVRLGKIIALPVDWSLEKFYVNLPLIEGQDILLNTTVKMPHGEIKLEGHVGKTLSFVARDAKINLRDVGSIAGVQLGGETVGDLLIHSDFKGRSYLQYELKGKKFSVLNYFLGKTDGVVQYNFHSKSLEFAVRNGRVGKAKFEGKGRFDFNSGASSGFYVMIKHARLKDVIKILEKHLPEQIIRSSSLIESSFSGQLNYEAVLSKGTFAIDVDGTGKYVFVLGEPFEKLSFSISDIDNVINVKKLTLFKQGKKLKANGLINLVDKTFRYEIAGEPIRLSAFNGYRFLNLNFDTNLIFNSSGQGKFSDFTSRTILKLVNSKISQQHLGHSEFELYNIGKEIFLTSTLFSKEIDASFYFNLGEQSKLKRSFAEVQFAIKDLRQYLAVLNPAVLNSTHVDGKFYAKLSSDFNWQDLSDLNLRCHVSDMHLNVGDSLFTLGQEHDFNIVEGQAVKQRLLFSGPYGRLELRGEGKLEHDFSAQLIAGGKLDWLTIIFSNYFDELNGRLHAQLELHNKGKQYEVKSKLAGEKIAIVPKDALYALTNAQVQIVQSGRDVTIRRLQGEINDGRFDLRGNVVAYFPYPQIDLNFQIVDMKVILLKDSSVIVSSYGKFSGVDRPYSLQGKINIESGAINAELTEISGHNKKAAYDTTYLPKIIRLEKSPLIEMNMDYDFKSPLEVKNSLVELAIVGKGKVLGNLEHVKPIGRVVLLPRKSKFMFKGNDFIISKGIITFKDNGDNKINPTLLILGQANVAQYVVYVDVKGDMENPIAELRSQPVLSQTDILSLLTIGLTATQANSMNDEERQLATSVGIGSVFANQLRLGKELNNMFGIKLSVMPELAQGDVNYADQISSTGNNVRVRNATKIELKKQLLDNVELSFSSTLGGNNEQTQKININYNFNKNMSIEGLYESKENGVENRLITPESLGVDFKMMMEFE